MSAGAYDKYSISAQRHIDTALQYVKDFRVCIQAGGHCGQFPVYLAQHFEAVYSWEPAPQDFADMVSNLVSEGVMDKVFPVRGMLGETEGMGGLSICSGSSKHRYEDGLYPIYVLDNIPLASCGLIYLDVEGDELPILKGAGEILRRFSPVVVTEEREKLVRLGAIGEYLSRFGYSQTDKHSADIIWTVT